MRKLKYLWLNIFILFLAQEVMAGTYAVYTEDKPVVLVSADSPRFVLKLKSNPTTGYAWYLRSVDTNLIKPIKHTFVAATETNKMGAPGYELWTFQVKPSAFVVPQQTMIRFMYARPWSVAEDVKQMVFWVTIQP